MPLVARAMAYRMAYSTIQVCEDTVNSLNAGSEACIEE